MRSKAFVLFIVLVLPAALAACAESGPFSAGKLPPDMTVGGPDCQYEDGGHFKGCKVIPRDQTVVKAEAARPVVVVQQPAYDPFYVPPIVPQYPAYRGYGGGTWMNVCVGRWC